MLSGRRNERQKGYSIGCLLSSHGESWAKYNLTEPIPLQVEHEAVESIVEPFRPSGRCLRTRKISAQCAVLTPAISPITGRRVEGGSVFLPALPTFYPQHQKLSGQHSTVYKQHGMHSEQQTLSTTLIVSHTE